MMILPMAPERIMPPVKLHYLSAQTWVYINSLPVSTRVRLAATLTMLHVQLHTLVAARLDNHPIAFPLHRTQLSIT